MKNKEINQLNDNGERHGYWEVYWDNNILWYKGSYVNDEMIGYWEEYVDGEIETQTFYIN